MGNFLKKAKEFFDWMEHVKLVVDVLIGLGAATVLRGLLLTLTHLNPVWITPIWLFAAAGVTYGMTRVKFSRKTEQPTLTSDQSVASSAIAPPPPPASFDAAQFFRTAYTSALTAEAEKNMRLAAQQNQPQDREGFYAKIVGIGLVAYLHDMTWWWIFKSQLLMLLELNKRAGLMPLHDAKPYYDKAVVDFPAVYCNYSFEQWIAYLISQQLILQHPSNILEITVRGKDFLKYLTHWGRYPEGRQG